MAHPTLAFLLGDVPTFLVNQYSVWIVYFMRADSDVPQAAYATHILPGLCLEQGDAAQRRDIQLVGD